MDTMIGVLVLVLMAFLAIALVTAVGSAARFERDRWRQVGRSKGATILLILLTGGFGGIYFWWRIRPELREAAQRPAPSAGRPPSSAELRAIDAQRSRGG
jgi:hypothetical protein